MQSFLSILTVPVAIVAFIAILIYLHKIGAFSFSSGSKEAPSKFQYRKKDFLLTINESKFYVALKHVAQEMDCVVFAKVRLEDLLWIPQSATDQVGLRNRIKSRHIDFVLCDKRDTRLIIAIELDDSTHRRQGRMEDDQKKNKILHDASLPLLRVRVQESYDPLWLKSEIAKLIDHPGM